MPTLRDTFLRELRATGVFTDAAALEARLVALTSEAGAAWPDIPLDAAELIAHLAARLPAGADLKSLNEVRHADLHLACACLKKVPRALELFEQRFLSHVPDFLRHMNAGANFGDEVRQIVGEKLLVGREGKPRLAGYSGRG